MCKGRLSPLPGSCWDCRFAECCATFDALKREADCDLGDRSGEESDLDDVDDLVDLLEDLEEADDVSEADDVADPDPEEVPDPDPDDVPDPESVAVVADADIDDALLGSVETIATDL